MNVLNITDAMLCIFYNNKLRKEILFMEIWEEKLLCWTMYDILKIKLHTRMVSLNE